MRNGGYYFRAVDPESGLEITGSLFIPSVIKSLLEAQGECDIAVCGCGDAGCAGFFGERFRKTADLVVWDINCNGEWYNLRFDRGVYERDAIAMLKDMVKRNIGWNEFAVEQFRDFAAFEAAVAKVVMANRERKRQAAREDGQLLMHSPVNESAAALSALPSNLSTTILARTKSLVCR